MVQNRVLRIEKYIKDRMFEQVAWGSDPFRNVEDSQDLHLPQEKIEGLHKNQLSQVDTFLSIMDQILPDSQNFKSILKKKHLRARQLGRCFLEKNLERAVRVYEESSSDVYNLRGDYSQQFQIILQLFPSFLFSLATQFHIAGKYHALGKELQIAGIAYLIRNGFPDQDIIRLFINDIKPLENTKPTPQQLGNQAKGGISYSQTILKEFYLFGKYFALNGTTNKHELIENQYIVQGIISIFLKYYFNLIASAPNDTIVEDIDVIFSNLLVYIRNKEKKYWADLHNADIIQVQLQHIVEQNTPPHFYKNRFGLLKNYNPLLYPNDIGKSKFLETQLSVFQSLSLKKLTLFLNLVHLCKGEKQASYLLFHLYEFKKSQFFKLESYLEQFQSQGKYTVLFKLTQHLPIVRKISSSKSFPPKLQLDNPNIDPDVRSWGKYLKNFYRSVLKGWEVSEEDIPVFFKEFAEESLQLLREKKVTQQSSVRFRHALDELNQQFIKRVGLHQQELQIYQRRIDEELNNIETVKFEERRQKIDNIGMVLVDAKQKEQKYEQLYKESLLIELSVNYNNHRHIFTVEEVLLLPLPNRQKDRLLETYVPRIISDEMMTAIHNLKLSQVCLSENHSSIYDIGKHSQLKTEKLLQLLNTSRGFEALIEREIIPIMFNNHVIKITVREFFTFPFFIQNSHLGEEWTAQHMQYLKLQTDNNEFPVSAYEIIANNLDQFPKYEYSKYFNIFHQGKFKDTVMEALIELRQKNGLEQLRK